MYKKNEIILEEPLEEEGAILLNPETGKTFILNDIGYCIWNNIEGQTAETLAELFYDNMANQEEYPQTAVRKYVEEYVKVLVEQELVVC